MAHEAELGLFAFALLEKPGLGVGGGGMGLVQALLPMEVYFRITTGAALGRRGIFGPENLQGAQASMRVPSTVKCSSDNSPA